MQTNYNAFRESKGIGNGDIIRTLRGKYPKYSKAQHSMVNNPEKNGVCLLPEAEALLVSVFGEGPGLTISAKKRKSHDNKDKPRRLCVRLSDPMFERVNALVSRMSFATMQDFIEAAIVSMLEKYGG